MKCGVMMKVGDFLKKLLTAIIYFTLYTTGIVMLVYCFTKYAETKISTYALIAITLLPIVMMFIVSFLSAWEQIFGSEESSGSNNNN